MFWMRNEKKNSVMQSYLGACKYIEELSVPELSGKYIGPVKHFFLGVKL